MFALTQTDPDPRTAGAVVLLLWGLADCFWGYRIFRFAIALLGALAGGWLLAAGAAQLGAGEGLRWAGFAVGALLGAVLSWGIYRVGVFVLGFAFGFTVAISLLPVMGDSLLLVVAGAVGLAAGLLALALQRVLLAAATAWSGAFRLALAAAFFFDRLDWQLYLRDPDQIPALVVVRPWISLVTLGVSAVGFLYQISRPDPARRRESGEA